MLQKQDELSELESINVLFDRLFPICRSIMGPGVRESLRIISEIVPELQTFSVPTGTKMFDWQVPQEWQIRDAWIKAPNGEKVVDFSESNLHVINYSEPVSRKIKLSDLRPYLHALPHLPDAIPYVTSYYKRRWGFCLSQHQLNSLPTEGEYEVFIDSSFVEGELTMAHSILPGESKKEVIISSYVCHPSLANNELSGPVIASFLYKRLASWPKRRFTYRFVFIPETIGSIAYLHRFGEHLKKNLHGGFVLTCLGGKGSDGEPIGISYKTSRREDSPVDLLMQHLNLQTNIIREIRPYTPVNGSDERQYCSPGFNLPIGQLSRTVYGTYKEYHTSLDTKEFMTIDAIQQSLDECEQILKALELDGFYVNKFPYGEIKLDAHNLYPDMNSHTAWSKSNNDIFDGRKLLDRLLMVLNYSDGKHLLSWISDRYGCNIKEMEQIIEVLRDKNLLEGPFETPQELK